MNLPAMRGARATLAEISAAVGVRTPADTAHLHHRPLTITVGHAKNERSGSIVNVITGFAPADATTSPPPPTTPPWKRPRPQREVRR